MTPALRLCIIVTLLTLLTATSPLDATLQRFKESPGLYYDHIGGAQLYNRESKILTYINLQEADQNLESVRKYAQLPTEVCETHKHTYWINFTDCTKITHYIDKGSRGFEIVSSTADQN
jgi:hypothetical protein